MIYPTVGREGYVDVEVQNQSATWAITVEGIRIRGRGGEWQLVPPSIYAERVRIEPHDACFATVLIGSFEGITGTELQAKVDIKTREEPVLSEWSSIERKAAAT